MNSPQEADILWFGYRWQPAAWAIGRNTVLAYAGAVLYSFSFFLDAHLWAVVMGVFAATAAWQTLFLLNIRIDEQRVSIHYLVPLGRDRSFRYTDVVNLFRDGDNTIWAVVGHDYEIHLSGGAIIAIPSQRVKNFRLLSREMSRRVSNS